MDPNARLDASIKSASFSFPQEKNLQRNAPPFFNIPCPFSLVDDEVYDESKHALPAANANARSHKSIVRMASVSESPVKFEAISLSTRLGRRGTMS